MMKKFSKTKKLINLKFIVYSRLRIIFLEKLYGSISDSFKINLFHNRINLFSFIHDLRPRICQIEPRLRWKLLFSYLQILIDDTGKIVDLTIYKITLILDGLSKVVEDLVDLCSMLVGAVSLVLYEKFAEKFILIWQLVNLFILRGYHHTRLLQFFSDLLHLILHRSQILAHVWVLFL